MRAWLLVLHLPAMVLWVGALLVVTSVLAAHCREAGVEARNALARLENKIFKRMVHPGAALMVITGVLLVLIDPEFYMRAPWLHAKLLLVVFLVGLDLRIYFRAKAFQSGKIEMRRGECVGLLAGVAAVFLGILILVMIKPI